jgi:hypothetical protein
MLEPPFWRPRFLVYQIQNLPEALYFCQNLVRVFAYGGTTDEPAVANPQKGLKRTGEFGGSGPCIAKPAGRTRRSNRPRKGGTNGLALASELDYRLRHLLESFAGLGNVRIL